MAKENGNVAESPRDVARRVAMALTAQLATANQADSERPTRSTLDSAPGPPPSLATAYVSMLPYAYTNSDVAQLFSQFGKLARVTILRDKVTRKSRGVAFVQFARAEDCQRAVEEMDNMALEERHLSCSLCRDNGRSHEFVRKRKYDATASGANRCFECGEYGHFSYNCPRNVLGERERPQPKKKLKKKKKKLDYGERGHYFNDEGVVDLLSPSNDADADVSLSLLAYSSTTMSSGDPVGDVNASNNMKRKRKAIGSYFSDESASDEEDDADE